MNRGEFLKALTAMYTGQTEPFVTGEGFNFNVITDLKTSVSTASFGGQIIVKPMQAADGFLEFVPVPQPPVVSPSPTPPRT